MDWTLLQFSIVILASDNNPTILNPDFLRVQGIVPEDWEISSPPITTPPFSTAQYSNGVIITVDQQKLQVVDSNTTSPVESKIVEIINKYIEVVPHVRYQAVGINFQVFCNVDDPTTTLKERFFKTGIDGENELSVRDVGVRLAFSLDSAKFTIKFDSGKIEKKTDKGGKICPVIIVDSNFNENIVNQNDAQERVKKITSKIDEFWTTFNKTLNRLI